MSAGSQSEEGVVRFRGRDAFDAALERCGTKNFVQRHQLEPAGNRYANYIAAVRLKVEELLTVPGERESPNSSQMAKRGTAIERRIALNISKFLEVDFDTLFVNRQNNIDSTDEKNKKKLDDIASSTIPRSFNLDFEVINSQSALQIYNDIRENDSVFILSSNGFLEATDDRFFYRMKSLVENVGCRLFYVFPGEDSDNRAKKDFEIIYYRIHKSYSELAGLFNGVFLRKTHKHLFGWNTRYIIIANIDKWPYEINVAYLFLNIGSGWWAKIDTDDHDFLHESIFTGLDPVPHFPKETTKFKEDMSMVLTHRYRSSFESNQFIEQYETIKNSVDSSGVVTDLLRSSISRVANRAKNRTNEMVLYGDVGCEDGGMTEVIAEYLGIELGGLEKVCCVGIETSYQENISDIFRGGALFCGPNCSFEDISSPFNFDFLTFVHSMYLINPYYLVKAYRLLNPGGILSIIASPLENNIINLITNEVDNYINDSRSGMVQGLRWMSQKKTFRNYGEEIMAAVETIFFRQYSLEKRIVRINTDEFVNQIDDLIDFFCHEIVSIPKHEKAKIANRVLPKARDGVGSNFVRSDVWCFEIDSDDFYAPLILGN